MYELNCAGIGRGLFRSFSKGAITFRKMRLVEPFEKSTSYFDARNLREKHQCSAALLIIWGCQRRCLKLDTFETQNL